MFTLQKARLPETIEVNGSLYKIHTDYRYFLRFREHLQDKNAKIDEFNYMYVDATPASLLEGLRQLVAFMNPPQELPRRTGRESSEIVIDYEIDAPYIYAAFMEQYGLDLLNVNLHWYAFNALLRGLHDTELNNIINARLYKPSGKGGDYEKARQKQYEAWRLPQPEDNEPDEALDAFLNQIKR